MLSSRFMRLGAALFTLVAALAVIWPHLLGHVAIDAVVNAPILTVRAPDEGAITEVAGGRAAPVMAGDTLVKLDLSRRDRMAWLESRSRQDTLGGALAALRAERGALLDLSARIAADGAAQRGIDADILDGWIAAIEAEEVAAQARIDLANIELRRRTALAGSGAVSKEALETGRRELALARAELAEVTGRLAARRAERQALAQGRRGALTGARDYPRERQDELAISIARLDARELSLQAEHAALGALISGLAGGGNAPEVFAPTAPVSGVVWNARLSPGASIVGGDTLIELLDCDHRYIEVQMPERLFDRIGMGAVATVRLTGSGTSFEARLMARAAAPDNLDGAAHTAVAGNVIEDGAATFLLALAPADMSDPEVAARYCDVGRTAEVRFPRGRAAGFDPLATLRQAIGMLFGGPGQPMPEQIRATSGGMADRAP